MQLFRGCHLSNDRSSNWIACHSRACICVKWRTAIEESTNYLLLLLLSLLCCRWKAKEIYLSLYRYLEWEKECSEFSLSFFFFSFREEEKHSATEKKEKHCTRKMRFLLLRKRFVEIGQAFVRFVSSSKLIESRREWCWRTTSNIESTLVDQV